jgi:MFS family permease
MADSSVAALPEESVRAKDKVVATSLISAHGLEHMYGHSFLVLLPAIYESLGLVPIQASLLSAVRQIASGTTSMGSGFFVDMYQHRRTQTLAISMALIGLGYLLVALSPTYGLILAALVVASAGSALWHPPALGLLAQRFPQQRGLLLSLHRSSGNVGDWVGSLLAGVLLGFVGWRWIMGGGTPLLFVLALVLLLCLPTIGTPRTGPVAFGRNLKAQLGSMRQAFRGSGMWSIFIVSAVRGMGDRAFVFFIPLYLVQELDKSSFWVGFHVALLAAPGIIAGPVFGTLSDRVGRKSIIIFIMAAAVILPLTTVLGGGGIVMTLSVALFGLLHFSVNSLTQAAVIDVVEGRGLEATFIGLMWGSNAFFGAVAAIIAGVLVGTYGWEAAFYFASALFFVGLIGALLMPKGSASQPRSA